jgi:hypothetical protein
MQTYKVTLTGKTPLLMHYDNVEWADFMDTWRADPANKKISKAGDDRTPSWRWLGCVYHDGKQLGLPSSNIMRCMMEAGAMVPVPGANAKKTFKAQTQSGMMSREPLWTLTVRTKPIAWAALETLKDLRTFAEHKQAVEALGFSLLVKRARIGQQKHIRVRPQFAADWQLHGSFAVWDEQIDRSTLATILDYAGQYKGLGDWRPGGKTPGPYGMFEATIE